MHASLPTNGLVRFQLMKRSAFPLVDFHRRSPCAERRGKVDEGRRQSEWRPRSSKGGDLPKLADAAAQTAARSGSSLGILRVKLGYAAVTAVATVEGRP